MISILTPDGSKGLVLRGIRTAAGNKAIETGSITTLGGDYTVWDGSVGSLDELTVTAEPPTVQGAMMSPIPALVDTTSAYAIVANGSAPYTYAWTIEDDFGFTGWQIASPTSLSTFFRHAGTEPGDTPQATMRCTVTDARGATGYVDVTALAYNYGSP